MSIGQIVRAKREARGWSQRDLERYTGGKVTQPKIARLENGAQTNITMETLASLAAGLGCAAVDLLPEEFKRPKSRAA